MKKLLLLSILVIYISYIKGQGFSKAEYFIDIDPGVNNGTPITQSSSGDTINFTIPINTTTLTDGFHLLGIRALTNDGRWSIFEVGRFYVSTSTPYNIADITSAEYFIDHDPGPGNGIPIPLGTSNDTVNFVANIPASLPSGFHQLAIRTKDADGIWGIFETKVFYVSPPPDNDVSAIVAAEYFFDTDPGAGNGVALPVGNSGPVVNFSNSIPLSLTDGSYSMGIRVKDGDGRWSLAQKRSIIVGNGSCLNMPADSFLGWWSFDVESNTIAEDIAKTHDAALVNGAHSVSDDELPMKELVLDGVDDYAAVPDHSEWAFGTHDFSIEMRAYFSSPDGDINHPGDVLIGQSVGFISGKTWTFAHSPGKLAFYVNDGVTSNHIYAQTNFNAVINQWYHLSLVRKGDTLRVYINGVLSGSEIVPNLFLPDVNSPLTIGWSDLLLINSGYMTGKLDEVTIHNRALTGQEILDISNKESAGKCKIPIITSTISDGTIDEEFSQTLTSERAQPPLTWSLSAGSLPPGLTLSLGGTISGIPTEGGQFPFTIKLTDLNNAIAERSYGPVIHLKAHKGKSGTATKGGNKSVPGRQTDNFILVYNGGTFTDTFCITETIEPWFTYVSSSESATILTKMPNIFTPDPNDSIPTTIQWETVLDPDESHLIVYGARLQPTIPVNFRIRDCVCLCDEAVTVLTDIVNCQTEFFNCVQNVGYTGFETCKPPFISCKDAILENQILMIDSACSCPGDVTYAPLDPNEKIVLAEKYIRNDALLPYAIHFENIGNIEAQDIFITDTLDEDLDETTLNILTPGGTYNPINRVLKWDLFNINLPPGETDNVIYTIRPKSNVASGTVVHNKAYIQFEVFDVIVTNETENIIDLSIPEGVMNTLPAVTDQTTFPISWTGSELIGEIKDYSIFVSVDGGGYELYLITTSTSATFSGENGKTYRFICVATDKAGNAEIQQPVEEAITLVDATCATTWYRDQDSDGYGDVYYPNHACLQPIGYVLNSTDCNDAIATVHPLAPEICHNFIDDDCDGLTDENCPASVFLKLFIEGFYRNNGTMAAVADPNGFPDLCDTINVSLHDKNSPFNLLYNVKGTIDINGNGIFAFPESVKGDSYYIEVKHRNSVTTWSKDPVEFNAQTVGFDFSISSSNAYGDNQKETFDHQGWTIYSGDINHDQTIDATDFLELDPSIQNGDGGYLDGDLNGDLSVDATDFLVLDPNIQNGIGASTPVP